MSERLTVAQYKAILSQSNNPKEKHHTSHIKKEWFHIGGKKFYSKSGYERLFAKYLQFLKKKGVIKDWVYEPTLFYFEGIKRGVTNYTPDFRVENPDGSIEYFEIKGWMDSKSKTKIKRMAKYHPTVKLEVRGKDWFKENSRALKLLPD